MVLIKLIDQLIINYKSNLRWFYFSCLHIIFKAQTQLNTWSHIEKISANFTESVNFTETRGPWATSLT